MRQSQLPLCVRVRPPHLAPDLHGAGPEAGGTNSGGVGRGSPAPSRIRRGIPRKTGRTSQRECRTAGAVETATAAVRKPLPPGKFKRYLLERLHLRGYFQQPGDGRPQPQIPAHLLLWSFVIGTLLRRNAFHALEALAHSAARQNFTIPRQFGDDTLGYFTNRLHHAPLRT